MRLLTVLCAICVATTLVSAADFGGFVTKVFANNFAFTNPIGPIGLIFDPNETGALYVSVPAGLPQSALLKFQASSFTGTPLNGASGVSNPNFVGNVRTPSGVNYANVDGLAFGKDGKLYCAIREQTMRIAEITKSTGQIARYLTNTLIVEQNYLPTSLATDPLTGDLFFGNTLNDGGISRIVSTANADTGSPATPTQALTALGGFLPVVDGIVFGPDGSLYFASFVPYQTWKQGVYRAARTSPTSFAAAVLIKEFTDFLPDGIQIWPGDTATALPKALFVATNGNNGAWIGTIRRLNTGTWNGQPGTCTSQDIYTGGTRGDFTTVGPDGCLYTTQSTTILKTTNADGTCSLLPVVPADSTLLTFNSPVYSSQCDNDVAVSATLKNLATNAMIANALVSFTAGTGGCNAVTNVNGIASCIIAGTALATGANGVNAAYAGSGTTISPASASATINVARGVQCAAPTQLVYNGPFSSQCDNNVIVSATLKNLATNAMISGATVSFTAGTGSCTGLSDGNGVATCTIVASALSAGVTNTVNVAYAGAGITLLPVTTTRFINVEPCAAPTQLVYTGATSSQCDADVVVSATLKNLAGNAMMGNAVITFTAGSGTCTDATDANGVATCTILGSALAAGANAVSVAYAGVPKYVVKPLAGSVSCRMLTCFSVV
eukprot:TRINITY_DN2643_c0_g2_i6.p1 TRINITY_DN2643_c0_g2~~TRINITY_DN2643_c0_g2_i6.p1  ORF type:complete len:667 (+),score=137.07 TRINITY_DN2643_c0_g2_i6:1408-3408(+)